MIFHENFEWDENKSEKNLAKHQVTFGDASYVLADEQAEIYHVEEFDQRHSDDEERYVTTASHPDDRSLVLRICWKDASTQLAKITRIISARAAVPREVKNYAEEIERRTSH